MVILPKINGHDDLVRLNDDERELCEAICELIKNNRKRVLLSKNALMIRESNGLKKTKEKWLSFIERILRSEG